MPSYHKKFKVVFKSAFLPLLHVQVTGATADAGAGGRETNLYQPGSGRLRLAGGHLPLWFPKQQLTTGSRPS